MKYLIQYHRGEDWTTLEPGVHEAIYNKPQVMAAIEQMIGDKTVIGIALQLPVKPQGLEQFNVMRAADTNLHPYVFTTKK